jgi:D-alanine-D-alanine ligase
VDICGYDYSGQAVAISANNVKWGYRTSSLPGDFIITGAILKLPLVNKENEQEIISQEISLRREYEPKGRSAGCVFKNISATDQAGRLIDEAGLKDFACGAARISKKHANYIINRKNATEEDIIRLMTEMRKRVAVNTGFYLTPEVVFVNPDALQKIKEACPAPKIAVLKGGSSSEREVSLNSGAAISNALRNAGYDVIEIDIKSCELTSEITSADAVFPALHGGWGENGDIQHLLEEKNIKFVGCNSAASKLVFDKIPSKELMDRENLPTPEWCVVTESNPELPAGMDFPLVVKAPRQGSTVGIFIVNNYDKFEKILPEAFKYDHELLLEKFIKGSELTVSIVNGEALTPIEIVPPNGFYDYDAKYTHQNGETQYLCPPVNIPQDIQAKASELAMKFYKSAGCRDLLRVDFIIDTHGSIYMIEANNLPGFTESSLVPKAFKQTRGSMEMLCTQLVQAALKR